MLYTQYESEDQFPQTFGIYDLTQFLSGYSLHCDISKGNTADLEFSNDSYVTIRGNGRSAKYFFSDPNITLQSVPETNIKFPGADFSFSVSTAADLVALHRKLLLFMVFQTLHSDLLMMALLI